MDFIFSVKSEASLCLALAPKKTFSYTFFNEFYSFMFYICVRSILNKFLYKVWDKRRPTVMLV